MHNLLFQRLMNLTYLGTQESGQTILSLYTLESQIRTEGNQDYSYE